MMKLLCLLPGETEDEGGRGGGVGKEGGITKTSMRKKIAETQGVGEKRREK